MTQRDTPQYQGGLITDIRRLEEQIVQLKVSLETFMARTMGRAEIEAEIISRVAQDTYQSDMKAMNDRLTRMESGPQRALAWLGAVTGCLGILIGGTGVLATVIFWLVANYHK